MIGTGGHGHTYPGATVPFGMAQVSPDNGKYGWDWCSGYHFADNVIIGFSHVHLSGTGMGDLLDVALMPTTERNLKQAMTSKGHAGNMSDGGIPPPPPPKPELPRQDHGPPDYPLASYFTHDTEVAKAGYYRVRLDSSGVLVELTATRRGAMHRYAFPAGETPVIRIDLEHPHSDVARAQTKINIHNHKPTADNETLITGHRISHAWALTSVYYAMLFSKPFERYQHTRRWIQHDDRLAMFFFPLTDKEETITVKVGISRVSEDGAVRALHDELPDWDFDAVRTKAEELWSADLAKVQVTDDNEKAKRIFYTAMYHTELCPTLHSDADGSYIGPSRQVEKTQGYEYLTKFSLWDTFRAAHPWYTIVDPGRVPSMVKSMLAHFNQTGVLPVWSLGGMETNTMPGYHAVAVLADAVMKGIPGLPPTEEIYHAMHTTATQTGRNVGTYMKYGYLPWNLAQQSVTTTLEYAFDDWCIAQVAKILGKEDDYASFTQRSRSYAALFHNGTGFMRGRNANGEFREPFDPKMSNHESSDYTEGNAWQHMWFVPHEVEGLVQLLGGPEKFRAKLYQFFYEEDSEITGAGKSADITGLIGQYAHGNEPSHHIAYMFNAVGATSLTQRVVRQILETMYNDQPAGLEGNEDCGQMSAWYVFSALGFYPMNPTGGRYELGAPIFKKAVISVGDGKTFTVLAPQNSKENIYANKVKLNGEELKRTYITHAEVMAGGTLEFEMSSTPEHLSVMSPA